MGRKKDDQFLRDNPSQILLEFHAGVRSQKLRRCGIVTHAPVNLGNSSHIFIAQCEIKNIKIVTDMIGILGTGNHNVSALDMPAENDLRVGLAVFCRKLSKYRLVYQILVTVSQRIPCH